jgi:peroxiredoxin
MKKILLALPAMLFLAFAPSNLKQLEIGDKAPLADVKMQDVTEQYFSLNDLKKDNGLLVIFSCNTCPFVIGWDDQYPFLGQIAERNNIGMVLVNSNEAKRGGEDSLEEMKKHFADAGYNTPYVIDENSKLADAFGANTTPHVYLFDGNMKLVFKGSINDKYEQKDKVATQFWLQNAIAKLGIGDVKGIEPKETKNIGCSIKRKS